MSKLKTSSFWTREVRNGEREFRTFAKVLFSILPLLLAALVYLLLATIGATTHGAEIVAVLAYGVVVLVAMLTLLVIMISLIEYLRSFE